MSDRLEQARRLLALAQTGLHYARDPFDIERYREIAAIAHAQIAALAERDAREVAQLFLPEAGYANPKLDVRCAVFDAEGRVLLVREVTEGLWSLPGGWADVGATPAENAAREVREESGYTVRIVRPMALWDMRRHEHPASPFHIWKLVFQGEIVGAGQPTDGETDQIGFFDVDALPPLSLARILPGQLRRLGQLYRDGGIDFD